MQSAKAGFGGGVLAFAFPRVLDGCRPLLRPKDVVCSMCKFGERSQSEKPRVRVGHALYLARYQLCREHAEGDAVATKA